MLKTPTLFISFLVTVCLISTSVFAQPTWTLDAFGKEKKPEQYEEKKLASEKTGEKKLTRFRRFIQNNTTRFNYYFNANNKLNAVVERAKLSQKDDFTSLLTFYPYTLENTAAQQTELDSVIYKSTGGILLHDLRSDWVDNMYLLIGKAYYYRNELDSAALTFQFINYNLFPRKKNEDDSRVVGTNDEPGTGNISIASKEKLSIVDKVFSLPPSRNDALIWLTRTFTTQKAYGDAAGLINILQNDRNLPQRLQNDLEEVTAYWFFSQNNYDSAAVHLEEGLSAAATQQDKSRWEFLLGQLYEMTGKFSKASDYYNLASRHTVDPVLDIHAQLNDAKMLKEGNDPAQLDRSINNLVRMARKDRYENYRDIIYYSAAQIALQKPDTTNSIDYLLNAAKYSTNKELGYRNKSFYQLGNIAYSQERFRDAASYYDSLQLTAEDTYVKLEDLNERKEALRKLVTAIDAVNRQDSLQRIAALPPAERDAYVKKLVRKLRKEQGIKEEDNTALNAPIQFANNNNTPTDLFESNTKGEWYFYNSSSRSKGLAEFQRKWGKRPNTDNWRRKTAEQATSNLTAGPGGDPNAPAADKGLAGTQAGNANNVTGETALNFDALMNELPTNQEKLDSSNEIIARSMLEIAQVFQNELEAYGSAISRYEEFLQRFPSHPGEAKAYLGLYFCYSKTGDKQKAAYYKNLLTSKHPMTNAAVMVQNPSLLNPTAKNPEVTQRYEKIYDLFIEGRFEEATIEKKKQDSLNGTNYWTPQLLYIEAVHYIKEREDSAAMVKLNDLVFLHPESPLKEKAATLIEVLGRRKEIETYLTNLEVTRKEEQQVVIAEAKPLKAPENVTIKTVTPEKVQPVISNIKKDTSYKIPPVAVSAGFKLEPEKPHFVVMILDKVDGVYINEAKNAFNRFNRESYLTQKIVINRDAIDNERVLLLFAPFEDLATAVAYYDKIKKAAPREVSWLSAGKYSFLVISDSNLEVLKTNKDLEGYRQLMNKNFENKF